MTRHTHVAPVLAAAGLTIVVSGTLADAASLQRETVGAWDAYVAATEARISRELASHERFLVQDFDGNASAARQRVLAGDIEVGKMRSSAEGDRVIAVPDGMIHHWRGSVFVPGIGVGELLTRLEHPSERGPHQEDVLALRVLGSESDRVRLFIKMTRRKIVTVTYNTEHDVTYRRYGPSRASSRSVATKIAELDGAGTVNERERPTGEDRGFLWRLNSYWRYEQVPGGVIVELESLTLSRDVPLGLGTLIEPIIDRVARESVARTLANLRRAQAGAAIARR